MRGPTWYTNLHPYTRDQIPRIFNKFDAFHGTKTLATKMTLKDAVFYLTVHGNKTHEFISNLIWFQIERVFIFPNVTKVTHTDEDCINGNLSFEFEKLWGLRNLQKAEKFYNPICATVLPNYRVAVNPGFTRLLLADVRSDELDVIVTDWTATLGEHKPTKVQRWQELNEHHWQTLDDFELSYFEKDHYLINWCRMDQYPDMKMMYEGYADLGYILLESQIDKDWRMRYNKRGTVEMELKNDTVYINEIPCYTKNKEGYWEIMPL
jgi:hypothetical protein